MTKNFLLAASLLAGVIIGAGIFALPFIFSKIGFGAGIIYLIAFTLVYIAIHLMYGETILKTAGEHRFAGYAETYLGRKGYYGAILMTIIGMFFVLAIYLVLSISFLPLIRLPGGASGLMIFWLAATLPIFLPIRKMALLEFLSMFAMIFIIAAVFLIAFPKSANVSVLKNFDWQLFLAPFGSLLFAFSGRTAIPQVAKYFKQNPTFSFRKAVIWGTVIPAFLYILFIYGIIALSDVVSEDALSGLTHIPNFAIILLAILGLLNIWTSYIIIGLDVLESIKLDLKFKKLSAATAVAFIPPIIYFLGFQEFLPLINFTGGVFLGLEGIFIVLMWQKIKKLARWRWLTIPLLVIFSLAITYQFYEYIFA